MKSDVNELHAQIALARLQVSPAIVARIRELHGGGLDHGEVAKHMRMSVDTVKIVLRAAT
jgi:DNA-directed RNA polymerase specialized sigma24 family protein